MKYDLSKLTDLQRYVTQECGTEKPFDNEFWEFYEEGIYLDIVSKEVLFSSLHKFATDCGWPGFYRALELENIVKLEDHSLGRKRIEVRSKNGDCHLGHVFTDGPPPTGIRYCINSAALEFVPRKKLKEYGLEKYENDFLLNEPSNDGKTRDKELEKITLGAGCFWGVEAILAKTPGVVQTTSGYCGGALKNPTYQDICTGSTGHVEVVQVEFDRDILSLGQLLDLFWRLHDPTTVNAQGYDRGTQYRSAIFCENETQLDYCKHEMQEFSKKNFYAAPMVTEILLRKKFYPAEEYHQNYYEKKYQGGQGPICHYVRGV